MIPHEDEVEIILRAHRRDDRVGEFVAWVIGSIIALVVLWLAGCGAPAKMVEPAPRAEPWCFRLAAERYGVTHTAQACADTYELCAFAQDRAVAFAGLAHFTEIGACNLARR